MKLRILGSGTSTGIPELGCTCEVCTSADPRDRRTRASALLTTRDATILIDCGPDFRMQMLNVPFARIDAVLVTHEHYDHVGGIDDLRPFTRQGNIPIYADGLTAKHLRSRMPYCLVDNTYPGVPRIHLEEATPGVPFWVNGVEVLPLKVMHGSLPILGYRIARKLGYVTDMLTLPPASEEALRGVDVLVMNALRYEPHSTHQSISQALALAKRIGARNTFFIHMSHQAGSHQSLQKSLPPHIYPAYDGMEIEF